MGIRTLIAKLAFSPMRIVRPSSLLLRVRTLTTASPFVRLPLVASSVLGDPFNTWPVSLSQHGLAQALRRSIIYRTKDNCDLEHWLVILEPPEPSLTQDQITFSCIKTLAEVLGSEEEAKKSIYSVYHLAFGCTVSEELSYKIKTLPNVRWVAHDPFLDLPRPFFDLSDFERWIAKIEVRNDARDRYFQSQCENMKKYYEDGLDSYIFRRTCELKIFGNPRKRKFLLQPTYQLVDDEEYGYPWRVNEGYQGGNQGYQGGGQEYQAGNLGGSMPGGSGNQANNSYQGHGPGYQGGAPAYGDNNFHWGDALGYQGGGAGPVHGQTGGSSSYQGGAGPPNFQTGGPAGPGCQGILSCQADGPYYQGRDLLKEAMAVAFKQVGQLTGPAGPGYQGSPDYQGRDLPGWD